MNGKLTGQETNQFRVHFGNGVSIRKLAMEYDISELTIYRTINGESWTDRGLDIAVKVPGNRSRRIIDELDQCITLRAADGF